MPREVAYVIDGWTQGTLNVNTANYPALLDETFLSPSTIVEDITGQDTTVILPDPNAFFVRVTGDSAVIDAIEADPDYVVISREEVVSAT